MDCKIREKTLPLRSNQANMFVAILLGRKLTIVYNSENQTLQFTSKDADTMNVIKWHLFGKSAICSQDVKISTECVKEYNVSFFVYHWSIMYLFLISIFSFVSFYSECWQSVECC